MKETMKTIMLFLAGTICGLLIFYFFLFGNIIDKRAKELNLMKFYKGEWVYKDTLNCNSWDFRYIKNGTMK